MKYVKLPITSKLTCDSFLQAEFERMKKALLGSKKELKKAQAKKAVA